MSKATSDARVALRGAVRHATAQGLSRDEIIFVVRFVLDNPSASTTDMRGLCLSRFDWDSVDWTKHNREIAAILGCSVARVVQMRRARGVRKKDMSLPREKKYDWDGVDWRKPNREIREELGCSHAALSAERKNRGASLKR